MCRHCTLKCISILSKVSSTEVEQESDKLADEFLEGDSSESNVDAFLEKFLEKRRLYHMRHVKVNKIKEIIEKQNANMTPSRRAPLPPSQNPVTSHQVPYNPSMNMMQNNVPSARPAPPGYRPNVPYRPVAAQNFQHR